MTDSAAYPFYKDAPYVAEVIADDLVYAFAHGWVGLPAVIPDPEVSERLTRLHAVRLWAERGGINETS